MCVYPKLVLFSSLTFKLKKIFLFSSYFVHKDTTIFSLYEMREKWNGEEGEVEKGGGGIFNLFKEGGESHDDSSLNPITSIVYYELVGD
jgi:hypothetical protein